LAVGVHDVILESGASVEFLDAGLLQQRFTGVLGCLLHEIGVSGEISFIHTEVISKISSVEGLDLRGVKAFLICVKIIVDEVVIIVHMAHDLLVFTGHTTKTLETGEGKQIGDNQIFEVIGLEKLRDSMSVWN